MPDQLTRRVKVQLLHGVGDEDPAFGLVDLMDGTSVEMIEGMSKAMSTMGYYLAMIFFCAQFKAAFGKSNLGALLAVEGVDFLKALGLPGMATIAGIILLSTVVNLVAGSA